MSGTTATTPAGPLMSSTTTMRSRLLVQPLLLAVVMTLLCRAGVSADATVPDVTMGPWCTQPAWHTQGVSIDQAPIHQDLLDAARDNNLKLIPFPTPDSASSWPNATTLGLCKYVAFTPGVIDGLGSMYSRALLVMAWAYLNNATYVHLPNSVDQSDAAKQVDRYLNLGHGELTPRDVPTGSTVCLVEHCGPHTAQTVAAYRSVAIEKMLAGSLRQLPPLQKFDLRKIIIAVHIRRGDVVFQDQGQGQDPGATSDRTPDSFYVDVIHNVTRDLSKWIKTLRYEIHMYSQGPIEQFANISGPLADQPLIWHLDEDEVTTLRGFACADVFIKGYSGLSGIGQWFSEGIMVYSQMGGWAPDANPYARAWRDTKIELTGRVHGRNFMHAGC